MNFTQFLINVVGFTIRYNYKCKRIYVIDVDNECKYNNTDFFFPNETVESGKACAIFYDLGVFQQRQQSQLLILAVGRYLKSFH